LRLLARATQTLLRLLTLTPASIHTHTHAHTHTHTHAHASIHTRTHPRAHADVVAVGHDVDLALLTVDDEAFWVGNEGPMKPLQLGDVPQLQVRAVWWVRACCSPFFPPPGVG
jgi:hypothetical protein